MSGATTWPAASLKEIEAQLCAPGAKFEMETVDVLGVPTRVWKNVPPTLRELAELGRSHGDRLFTIYEDDRVSYEAWYRATAKFAQYLLDSGVKKGDRIALAMRNLPEFPVVYFAATCIGATLVPLNAWWTGAELSFGLENSGSRMLVSDPWIWKKWKDELKAVSSVEQVIVTRAKEPSDDFIPMESILGKPNDYINLPDTKIPHAEIHPDDAATIFYTSGTTGKPKGAVGTHRNATTNIFSSSYSAAQTAMRRGDPPPTPVQKVGLLVIPLFHVTACNARMMGAVAVGHTLIFMFKWDTKQAYEIIEKEGVHSTGGVPTIAWQLLEHPDREKYDLSTLEGVSYGGAPAAPELVRKIKEVFGAEPGSGWGMTETSATVTIHSAEDYLHRPDSCGPPVPVADLKIMSPDGTTELPVGEVGELYARGPMCCRQYWERPEATAETFIDGWVKTGDLARLDEEGFCFIVDRAKDIIIRGGENIYSSEVENVLYDHPAVTDAALIGIPHRTLGEEPAAVVHCAPGMSVSEDELKTWVLDRLAKFKTPVKIIFCDETLPRNANGKILKKDLKSLFEDEGASA
ncbi:MAG: fatty acid--CoA ligase [Ponticaulis sp.]|nr:fatty acid--CoA ligase [Ponticaulis sp.]|tara:strand:- start:23574 stop:25301 length:1728 start_codon:yes stop_codon:yes gene_type:complete